MAESYYYWHGGRWRWWRSGWRDVKLNDGKRYPAATIVLLTYDSFDYAFHWKKLSDPPVDSSEPAVKVLNNIDDWQSDWDRVAQYKKLLVYEFFEKNSPLCTAMDKPLEQLANKYKGKADFRKLDVDNFEFLAGVCGVEGAYPTFVIFKNCRQVGKVVGVKEDELDRSIQRALN